MLPISRRPIATSVGPENSVTTSITISRTRVVPIVQSVHLASSRTNPDEPIAAIAELGSSAVAVRRAALAVAVVPPARGVCKGARVARHVLLANSAMRLKHRLRTLIVCGVRQERSNLSKARHIANHVTPASTSRLLAVSHVRIAVLARSATRGRLSAAHVKPANTQTCPGCHSVKCAWQVSTAHTTR